MFQSSFRTIVLYLALIASVRLMGKRQVGQMEPSEFVVTMLVANLASIPMEEPEVSVFYGLLPIGIVVAAELLLSWVSIRSIFMRKLLCGKPVILIENGRILQGNLRRTRITLDELTGHLRTKEVLDLNTVQYAILETNGELSVFLYPENSPADAKSAGISVPKQYLPITIIEDGQVIEKNLVPAQKDRHWVDKTLKKYATTIEETYLLTVDKANHILWIPKEKG